MENTMREKKTGFVLEGMKTIPHEFLPAQKNGKNVKVRCYFPYTFKSN
jgi:hypothetical protein